MRLKVLKTLLRSVKESNSLWSKLKTYRVIFLFIAYIPVSLLAKTSPQFSNINGQELLVLPGNTHCILINGNHYEVWPLTEANKGETFEIEMSVTNEWDYFHEVLKEYEIELAKSDQ